MWTTKIDQTSLIQHFCEAHIADGIFSRVAALIIINSLRTVKPREFSDFALLQVLARLIWASAFWKTSFAQGVAHVLWFCLRITFRVRLLLPYKNIYRWLSQSRITAYLVVKIWSLSKHENLTTCLKYFRKEEKFSLFHNIFNISLTSRVQLHIYLLTVVNRISFSSILQIWYVEVRISRSISERPLEFEITIVDCIVSTHLKSRQFKWIPIAYFKKKIR